MTPAADPAGSWWVFEQTQLPDGRWNVRVQFSDGQGLRLVLEPSDSLDDVITAAVNARLARDRRWTKRSDRG